MPTRFDHFTEVGEPLTTIAGIVLERAMMVGKPPVIDGAYAEQQVTHCCNDQVVRIGTRPDRKAVIAAAREILALGAAHSDHRSQEMITAIAALE